MIANERLLHFMLLPYVQLIAVADSVIKEEFLVISFPWVINMEKREMRYGIVPKYIRITF